MLLNLLSNAMERGDVDALINLLDLNETDADGSTTLMSVILHAYRLYSNAFLIHIFVVRRAAETGNAAVAILLIQKGASLNILDKVIKLLSCIRPLIKLSVLSLYI